jgi:hypothetical protein
LLLSHKRKVELTAPSPIKALKSGTALMMWMPAIEWLRTREAAAKAGASAQEVTGPGDAVQEQSQLRQSRTVLGSRCPALVG